MTKRLHTLEEVNNNVKLLNEMLLHYSKEDSSEADKELMKVGVSLGELGSRKGSRPLLSTCCSLVISIATRFGGGTPILPRLWRTHSGQKSWGYTRIRVAADPPSGLTSLRPTFCLWNIWAETHRVPNTSP